MDAIYARQSVDKKDSVSIETQLTLCGRYAGEGVLIFQDRGFSGKNTNRPDFQRLMELVESGQVQKIIVYRLDRFSRSIADFGQVWDRLEKHGVEFQSVTENFDTSSPMGRAMLNIVLVFAQLERETIAERVRDNYLHRFSLGAWPGGPAPYGFSLTKVTDGMGRQIPSLKADQHAETVRRIFSLYAQEGSSLRSVARSLNAEAVPGPRRGLWDNVTLSRILHSPLYVQATEDVYWWYMAKGLRCEQDATAFDGTYACNVIGKRNRGKGKYRDLKQQEFSLSNHAGFISPEQWLACQSKLDRNVQVAPVTSGKHSWLTGLLKCKGCGYAVKINRDGRSGKFYLVCSGRTNLGACTQSIKVDLRELEENIAQQIRKLLRDCPPAELDLEERGTSQELWRIEERIDRLVNALAESSTVSAAYISTQIDRLHTQREQLASRVQSRSRAEKCRRLDFDAVSMEEKKIVAREFIEKILLADDCADVMWKL